MSELSEKLFTKLADNVVQPHAKVTVVGVGQVGMACTFSIMIQGFASEIVLIDVDKNKVNGEIMDLNHGQAYMKHCRITGGIDYALTKNSKVCVVTAGARQREGESRLSLIGRNIEIYKSIIPKLATYSPNAILLIVSNPVDILTWAAWKMSGFPANRVFGSGCALDSSRFRQIIAKQLGIAPNSCHAWIIGEHGDSSVAVWSGANVAGVPLRQLKPDMGKASDSEHWGDLHKRVINSAYEIIKLKGYTSWAIGLSVAAIIQSIMRNECAIFSVSTNAKGLLGIKDDVFLSLPGVLSENGLTNVVKMANLNEEELSKLQKSAETLAAVQKETKL